MGKASKGTGINVPSPLADPPPYSFQRGTIVVTVPAHVHDPRFGTALIQEDPTSLTQTIVVATIATIFVIEDMMTMKKGTALDTVVATPQVLGTSVTTSLPEAAPSTTKTVVAPVVAALRRGTDVMLRRTITTTQEVNHVLAPIPTKTGTPAHVVVIIGDLPVITLLSRTPGAALAQLKTVDPHEASRGPRPSLGLTRMDLHDTKLTPTKPWRCSCHAEGPEDAFLRAENRAFFCENTPLLLKRPSSVYLPRVYVLFAPNLDTFALKVDVGMGQDPNIKTRTAKVRNLQVAPSALHKNS